MPSISKTLIKGKSLKKRISNIVSSDHVFFFSFRVIAQMVGELGSNLWTSFAL